MEEPDNLEVATNPVLVRSSGIHSFIGNWTELEYGAKGWWTTEFYMDSQHTRNEGSLFTGFVPNQATAYEFGQMVREFVAMVAHQMELSEAEIWKGVDDDRKQPAAIGSPGLYSGKN